MRRRGEPWDARPGLVIADPTFDLRGARREGQALYERSPNIQLLEGSAATLSGVREALEDHPGFLHVAAHVQTPDERPEHAYVRLANGTRLGIEELAFMGLPPITVVLTACEATKALELPWGGRLSLGAMFLLAGARSVVGPTRAVSDTDGMRFGLAFHKGAGVEHPGPMLTALRAKPDVGAIANSFVLLGEP